MLFLSRVWKTAMQHIRRNANLSIASSLIMALTFFVSSVFVFLIFGASLILNYVEMQSQIIVFFSPDTVTQPYIDQVKQSILDTNLPDLRVNYVSKQDAYKKFIDYWKRDSPDITQSVNQDKLPPSLEVKTARIDDLQKIADVVANYQKSSNSQIDKVLYYKNVEDFLKEFIKVVKYLAIGFILFLVGISLLIVWITIGIAVATHKDEIEIMQLVGATSSYIELPFIIEGAIYGVIGAAVSSGLFLGVYLILTKVFRSTYINLLSYFQGIPVPHPSILALLGIILFEILLGAIVGSLGSFIAMRNKLK